MSRQAIAWIGEASVDRKFELEGRRLKVPEIWERYADRLRLLVGFNSQIKAYACRLFCLPMTTVAASPAASLKHPRLNIVTEAGTVLLLDGPRADENQEAYVWWYARDLQGNEGWVVEDFLEPTLPPNS